MRCGKRFFHAAGLWLAIHGGCAAVPATQPKVAVASTEHGGRCSKTLGRSPFSKPDATYILIADFYGLQTGDAQFAQNVSKQISSELRRFEEEELPNFPVHVPTGSLELQRLPCFIDSHVEADAIAAAWGVDLVVWGKAYCNPNPEQHVSVHNETRVAGNDVAVAARARNVDCRFRRSQPARPPPSPFFSRAPAAPLPAAIRDIAVARPTPEPAPSRARFCLVIFCLLSRALGQDIGNMFQYDRDFETEYCAVRDIATSRALNPELQSFATWLDRNKRLIPIPA